MKWFEKHTDDRNRLDSKLIQRKFGLAGYGMYEKLQQIAAENMEGSEVSEWGLVAVDWTMDTLANEIGCEVRELKAFLKFCDDNMILEKRDGRLFVPIVMERMNEYAKRQYRKSVRRAEKDVKDESPEEKVSQEIPETSDSTDNSDSSECTDTTDKPAIQHNTVQHNTTHVINTMGTAARPAGSKSHSVPIGQVVAEREPVPQNTGGGGITQPYQDAAFRHADGLGIKLKNKDKGRFIKIFKEEHMGIRHAWTTERAFTYLADNKKFLSLDYEIKLKYWFDAIMNGFDDV